MLLLLHGFLEHMVYDIQLIFVCLRKGTNAEFDLSRKTEIWKILSAFKLQTWGWGVGGFDLREGVHFIC